MTPRINSIRIYPKTMISIWPTDLEKDNRFHKITIHRVGRLILTAARLGLRVYFKDRGVIEIVNKGAIY